MILLPIGRWTGRPRQDTETPSPSPLSRAKPQQTRSQHRSITSRILAPSVSTVVESRLRPGQLQPSHTTRATRTISTRLLLKSRGLPYPRLPVLACTTLLCPSSPSALLASLATSVPGASSTSSPSSSSSSSSSSPSSSSLFLSCSLPSSSSSSSFSSSSLHLDALHLRSRQHDRHRKGRGHARPAPLLSARDQAHGLCRKRVLDAGAVGRLLLDLGPDPGRDLRRLHQVEPQDEPHRHALRAVVCSEYVICSNLATRSG
jgi:hypothetical protein